MRGTQSSAQYVGRVSLAVVSTQELLTGTSPGIVMRNFILGEGLGAVEPSMRTPEWQDDYPAGRVDPPPAGDHRLIWRTNELQSGLSLPRHPLVLGLLVRTWARDQSEALSWNNWIIVVRDLVMWYIKGIFCGTSWCVGYRFLPQVLVDVGSMSLCKLGDAPVSWGWDCSLSTSLEIPNNKSNSLKPGNIMHNLSERKNTRITFIILIALEKTKAEKLVFTISWCFSLWPPLFDLPNLLTGPAGLILIDWG